jgi:hypothetical protein
MQGGFPMGDEFFELVAAGEEGCEKVTGQSADGLGERAPPGAEGPCTRGDVPAEAAAMRVWSAGARRLQR